MAGSPMSAPVTLDDLVTAIVEGTDLPEPSFAALLDQIHTSRYSGSITFHFDRGKPRAIELPRPSITLQLATGA